MGTPECVALRIRPRSGVDVVVGEREGAIEIRLQAPPVDGAANEALRRFVAQRLGVAPRAVTIVRGFTGRHKSITVDGMAAAGVRAALLGTVPPPAS
ncbi:DUF167 domain-containing protein [Cyanobium sp. FGCU-52]|nr:DUF167 domain-containing protein [Cyanobium sp. FGCU52]